MKYFTKSFSLLELIFTIALIGIISSQFIPKNNLSKLNIAADKIIMYLKYTRYIAMIDNKYNHLDDMWFRERWTVKFQNCSSSIGGLYYVVYSDTNHGGGINKSECLKDPITNKYLYSHYDCNAGSDESKYVLLTKTFGVTNIDITCNKTSTIGQISFDHMGKAYSKIGLEVEDSKKYYIKDDCLIKMYDKEKNMVELVIEGHTGFIYKR